MRLPGVDWILIGGASVLLSLAYPPFRFVVPAFVCLVPATLLILRGAADERPGRRHAVQGFWYGAVTHGVLLHWLAWALWQRDPRSVSLYVMAVVVFGCASAVAFALVGRAAQESPARLIVALPAAVVLLEWLVAAAGPLGFPWHQLALTLAGTPSLVQVADLAGAQGVAFVLVLINVLVGTAVSGHLGRSRAIRHLAVAFALVVLMAVYGTYRIAALPLLMGPQVAVIQPNATVEEKGLAGLDGVLVERTLQLTERALAEARPRFIVWPETALPDALQLHPIWSARLAQLANRSGSTLLTGAVDLDGANHASMRRYNAAFAFFPAGAAPSPVYRKRKLVPWAEWTPRGQGGFTPGQSTGVANAAIGSYGVLICYELTFPQLASEARRAGAEVLVTLSNDAWFGASAAPHQHFAHATLRAIENRVTVVRAANTGISGIVDPLGRVVVRTEPFVGTYAAAPLLRAGMIPLSTRSAGLVGPLSLGLLLALLAHSTFPGARRVLGAWRLRSVGRQLEYDAADRQPSAVLLSPSPQRARSCIARRIRALRAFFFATTGAQPPDIQPGGSLAGKDSRDASSTFWSGVSSGRGFRSSRGHAHRPR